MTIFLKYLFNTLFILLLWIQTCFSQGQIPISKNLKLTFEQDYSSFNLVEGNKVLLSNMKAAFQLKGQEKRYVAGTDAKFEKLRFKDHIGYGTKYIISYGYQADVAINQIFYTYDQYSFVITQLELLGKNISSNQLIPLEAIGDFPLGTNLYNLFIPFDNDTFIAYEKNRLTDQDHYSAEIGLILDDASQFGLLVASLDQSQWKTGIRSKGNQHNLQELSVINGFTDVAITRDSMGHGFLSADRILSSKILIDYSTNWQTSLEGYAKFQRQLSPSYVAAWKEGTPIGWNSWGVIQTKLNFENATANVDYFNQEIPSFRNEHGKAYIDLDSFWDNMVPGGMSGDYSKLKEFVSYCEKSGLEAGVYWAPFTDWGHGSGPNRKAEGSTYTFGEMWTKTAKGYHDLDGGRALDPTHPGTQARMRFILGKLKECGFKMIKIDFLSHAAIESTGFYDHKISTGMQAYSIGMRLINDILDGQMLIYAAISPSIASYPYIHMRRIACDAWKTIEQTAYTLNSVSFGWWQTHLYDYIDADHLVFTGESPQVNEARLISGLVTGTIILGDDFSKKEDWQKLLNDYLQDPEILQIIKDGKSFLPLAPKADAQVSTIYHKKIGQNEYIAFFNFSNQEQTMELKLKDLGIQGNAIVLKDLLSKKKVNSKNKALISLDKHAAVIYKVIK